MIYFHLLESLRVFLNKYSIVFCPYLKSSHLLFVFLVRNLLVFQDLTYFSFVLQLKIDKFVFFLHFKFDFLGFNSSKQDWCAVMSEKLWFLYFILTVITIEYYTIAFSLKVMFVLVIISKLLYLLALKISVAFKSTRKAQYISFMAQSISICIHSFCLRGVKAHIV